MKSIKVIAIAVLISIYGMVGALALEMKYLDHQQIEHCYKTEAL